MLSQKIVYILLWKKIDYIIYGKITECDLDEKISYENLSCFKYASIVFCDVERNFSN